MNMFGCIWLASADWVVWLFPALIACSAWYMLVLLRRTREHGYGPIGLSLSGAIVTLAGRVVLAGSRWLLVVGVLLVVSGSIMSSLRQRRSGRRSRARQVCKEEG